MSKKLLVLGATGGTGLEVVRQALEAGHDVTAYVRNPAKLTMKSDRLRVQAGGAIDSVDGLRAAMRGQDAVITALGNGNSLKSHGLFARSTPVIVRAMESVGIRRLVVCSAFGVGETWRDTPLIGRLVIRVLLRDLYADKEIADALLRRCGLDWTIVYPTSLANGPRTGLYRVGERLALRGNPKISRADVADFMLKQVTDNAFVRKGVLVSY